MADFSNLEPIQRPQGSGGIRGRISQRDLFPSSVKSRHLGVFIFGAESEEASTTMENGQEVFVTATITQNDGYEIFGHPYLSMYVGNIAVANLLPGGSSVDESQWNIIGPHFEFYKWSDTGFAKHKEITTIYVRNISAGSVTLTFRFKWKYVSSRSEADRSF